MAALRAMVCLLALGPTGCLGADHAPPAPPGMPAIPQPRSIGGTDPGGGGGTGGDGWGPTTSPEGPLDVRSAAMHGTLGGVRIDGVPYETSGTHTASFYRVAMYAHGDGGEAMGALVLSSPADAITLEPGDHFDTASAVAISGLGCSGLERGAWSFDQPVSDGQVDVREGSTPNSRRVDYSLTFNAADQIEGFFEVAIDPGTGALIAPRRRVVEDATLTGQLGPIVVAGSCTEVFAASEASGISTVVLNASEPSTSGRLRLELYVEGTLDHADLVPGASLRFPLGGGGRGDGSLYVAARGWSGAGTDAWDTTADAGEVRVDVLAVDRIHVEAIFGTQHVDAIFQHHLE